MSPARTKRKEFEEALDMYLHAENAYRNQTALDGMDNGGPLRIQAETLRYRLLGLFDLVYARMVHLEQELQEMEDGRTQ